MSAKSGYAFVVDTEIFAGGFEREMVAYMTGFVGECGVGEEIAEEADALLRETLPKVHQWLRQHVELKTDNEENPCPRPAQIYPTPGWFNDGMGDYFRDGADPGVVCRAYVKAVEDYFAPLARAAETRAEQATDPAVALSWRQDAARSLERIKEAQAREVPFRFHAYLSVALWLTHLPPPFVREVLEARARSFAAAPPGPFPLRPAGVTIAITGFRVINLQET